MIARRDAALLVAVCGFWAVAVYCSVPALAPPPPAGVQVIELPGLAQLELELEAQLETPPAWRPVPVQPLDWRQLGRVRPALWPLGEPPRPGEPFDLALRRPAGGELFLALTPGEPESPPRHLTPDAQLVAASPFLLPVEPSTHTLRLPIPAAIAGHSWVFQLVWWDGQQDVRTSWGWWFRVGALR